MKKAFTFFHDHYFKIGLGVILCASFFLRILRLSTLPNCIHVDEAALGYNAWCLSHFGVDRYLNEMPIYPKNYYGGQSPLYTYLVALLITVIGKGDVTLLIERLPSLIFNMLGLIFSVKTIHLVFKSKPLTLACSFLASFLPYYFMQGRIGLDCNLMYGCCTVAVYLAVRYASGGKRITLCLCGAVFGLAMYSYALSYLFVPLCLCLFALYLLFLKKISIPDTLLWAAVVCVTSLPILLFVFCLLFKLEPFQFLFFHIYPVSSGRMTEVSLQDFWQKLWYAIRITLTNDDLIVNSVPKFGTVYCISIPFIGVGFGVSFYQFIRSLKNRQFHYSGLFFLYYVACLITAGLVEANVNRANFFYTAYIYFLLLGIHSVYHFLQGYRRIFAVVLTGGFLLWALSFVRFYFKAYEFVINTSMYYNPYYFVPPLEAVRYAETQIHPETIYIDAELDEVFLFFDPISPYEWAGTRQEDGDGYGHYKFKVDFKTPISMENAYLALKENGEFIDALKDAGIPYETIEYEYYILFYFRGQ